MELFSDLKKKILDLLSTSKNRTHIPFLSLVYHFIVISFFAKYLLSGGSRRTITSLVSGFQYAPTTPHPL